MRFIGPETEARLDWLALTDALRAGHLLSRAQVKDSLLQRGSEALLTRSAWIDGLGLLVKAATVYPGNTGVPTVNGGATLYSDRDGRLEAVIDFHLLTKWKTAGDSLLAARLLARKDSENILIVGAGTVAKSLTESYHALFPKAKLTIWSRSLTPARTLADACGGAVAGDLEAAVRQADIIACATMAKAPVVLGDWLRPGQHLDLIGAWKSDMRETDDTAMRRAKVFVDSRATTIGHIGEIDLAVASGALRAEDIRGDFYDIASGAWTRKDDDITLFKNGGGAHLDLMCATYFLTA